jgi:hypothetical protein
LLSRINRRPLLEPVWLKPDAIASLPYAPLAFGSGLAWIAKREVSARADFEVGAIEDVEVFITATIATKNVENRGSVGWTEAIVA